MNIKIFVAFDLKIRFIEIDTERLIITGDEEAENNIAIQIDNQLIHKTNKMQKKLENYLTSYKTIPEIETIAGV